jgi:hypothetical protein
LTQFSQDFNNLNIKKLNNKILLIKQQKKDNLLNLKLLLKFSRKIKSKMFNNKIRQTIKKIKEKINDLILLPYEIYKIY